MKRVITAKTAGFCAGVARSVTLAERALEQYGTVYCIGSLVHNHDEIARLEAMGMMQVDSAEDVPPGAVVLLRAHGEGKAVYAALEARGATVIDTTCGKVEYIHSLARRAAEEGKALIVFGDPTHPEVQGICGWCPGARAVSDADALEKLLAEGGEWTKNGVLLVFQSTETKKNFEKSENIAKKLCTNPEIFDTICSATQVRQSEALELSGQCDIMVVIGGKHSANSRHLAEICAEVCGQVLFVENAAELDTASLSAYDTAGITAGASVPRRIIKEVKQKMCDEIKDPVAETTAEENIQPAAMESAEVVSAAAETEPEAAPAEAGEAAAEAEKSFEELLNMEDSVKTIYNRDVVKGVVAAITPTEVTVDIGAKYSGYIPLEEFEDESGRDVTELIHIGDSVEASVVCVNDVEGTVVLSKRRLDAVKNWDMIEEACTNETLVEGVVTEENKGGIVVRVMGLRVFVPASQSGLPREAEMSQLLHQKVQLYITEVNRGRRRIVGSIRLVAAKARRAAVAKVWDEIEVGKRYHGTVKSLTSYGAFVDIGGVDGMVHVSELSWKRITKPADVVSVGDEIEVYVINFDRAAHRISLGYKDPNENPWEKFTSQYKTGDVASVRIVKLMTFGVFAEIVPGVDGLIHISQIANRRIGKPDEVLNVNDIVDVRITAIDEEKHKVSLSIRALSEPIPAQKPQKEKPVREREPRSIAPKEDALVYEVSETGVSTGNIPEIEDESEES
ncbi:MAG: bifunctional 4-hydroxy-3-methylbut-2-enyl diphosphate reductase/30S ribosomal protein S1 [Oscillospiraceae bacterium]|nr:bifunctional 4-hydroxy-3-methylbut-2-enyl diphosphate reductase/30S ribosomal protein S1 [Oscillospiraceae bacterium]